MSERDGQIRENDELIIRLTTEFAKVKNQVREFVQQQQYQQQMRESQAAAEQSIVNMESLADQAAQGLLAAQQRAAEIQEQELRAAAAENFAAAAGGIINPPPSTEAGGGIPPPFNNNGTHATTGQNVDEQGRALSNMSLNSGENTPTEMSWDPYNGGQTYWDTTSHSNAQNVDPRLKNPTRQLSKKARLEQQRSRPMSRGTMPPPGATGAGGSVPPTNNPGSIPSQSQQQTNVTHMHAQQPGHQPPPVGPQQNQQGLQGGLPVTRPEAALLTTNLQQPQQQLPQHQQMVNAQTSYNFLAQPVPLYSQMVPPGVPTPLALQGPHPPPQHQFQTVQQQQNAQQQQHAQQQFAQQQQLAQQQFAQQQQQGAAGGQFMPPNAQQQQQQQYQQYQYLLWQQQQQNQLQLQTGFMQTAQVLKEIHDGNQRTQENRDSDLRTIAESIHARKLVIKDHVPM